MYDSIINLVNKDTIGQGVEVKAFSPGILEVKKGGSLQVPGQSGLHNEILSKN